MNKASRARGEQRSQRPASIRPAGLPGSGPPSVSLSAALATAAELSTAAAVDPRVVGASHADPSDPPRSGKPVPSQRGGRAHLEDDFFAKGEEFGSVRPSTYEPAEVEVEVDEAARRKSQPHVVARRARMRRFVAGVVGAAALLTVLIGAKALVARTVVPPANDSSLTVSSRIVPSIALNEPQKTDEPAKDRPDTLAAEPARASESRAPDVAEPRKLPVIDVEIPETTEAATIHAWDTAASRLSSGDFKAADDVFADLGRSSDVATRETARLARAVWWMNNGKRAEVRPVVADLAAKATTPSVQKRARELLSPSP